MSVERERQRLIEELTEQGIRDQKVLHAMAQVPRERFVRAEQRAAAYENRALPIDAGQTISQPYMVALMTELLLLTGNERVLEIGTGSGYQAAILARLCRQVVSIERIEELSVRARQTLDALGCTNIELHVGDGSLGWPALAPYDRIIVTAGAPGFPEELYRQLTPGGRLVIPVGDAYPQLLQVIDKTSAGPKITDSVACSFVPLIGAAGWPDEQSGE
jgi:protein-L-isoaspartate(D-aspartate) O-methyltransferase